MNPLRPRDLTAVAAAALLAVSTASSQSFSTFGAGCPGSAGVPTLQGVGLPALGQNFQIQLGSVPPGAPSSLWLGSSRLMPPVDLGFVGSPGCVLLTLPDLANLDAVASPLGTRTVGFMVPNDPGLAGAVLETQWVVLDLAFNPRVTTSNGGTAQFDVLPPPVSGGSFSGPASGPVGTIVEVRVTDLGTSDPNDICLRGGDPTFGLVLFRALAITTDPMTGEDVITAEFAAGRGSPVGAGGELMLMRGCGEQPAVNVSGCLSVPTSSWSWEGFDVPGADLGIPATFSPMPSGMQLIQSFVYDAGSNSLLVDIPDYPWDISGLYPPGSSVTTDAHGDTLCSGGAPVGGHFDHFLRAATVDASCVAGITKQTLAIDHAPQVQEAFDNTFGPGRLTVTADTGPSFARIRITPTNPSCVLTGGGGSLVISP